MVQKVRRLPKRKKMIAEGSKASGNAFKNKTNGNGLILGKRGRFNGLNSFKINTKIIKLRN